VLPGVAVGRSRRRRRWRGLDALILHQLPLAPSFPRPREQQICAPSTPLQYARHAAPPSLSCSTPQQTHLLCLELVRAAFSFLFPSSSPCCILPFPLYVYSCSSILTLLPFPTCLPLLSSVSLPLVLPCIVTDAARSTQQPSHSCLLRPRLCPPHRRSWPRAEDPLRAPAPAASAHVRCSCGQPGARACLRWCDYFESLTACLALVAECRFSRIPSYASKDMPHQEPERRASAHRFLPRRRAPACTLIRAGTDVAIGARRYHTLLSAQ
jgi:hypothetical protein